MAKSSVNIEVLVDGLDLPHKRHAGWKWAQTGPAPASEKEFSRRRLVFYAQKLRALGMSDGDLACLLGDLYWDSYLECRANGTFAKA